MKWCHCTLIEPFSNAWDFFFYLFAVFFPSMEMWQKMSVKHLAASSDLLQIDSLFSTIINLDQKGFFFLAPKEALNIRVSLQEKQREICISEEACQRRFPWIARPILRTSKRNRYWETCQTMSVMLSCEQKLNFFHGTRRLARPFFEIFYFLSWFPPAQGINLHLLKKKKKGQAFFFKKLDVSIA